MKIPLWIKACVLAVSGMVHNFTRLLLFFLQITQYLWEECVEGIVSWIILGLLFLLFDVLAVCKFESQSLLSDICRFREEEFFLVSYNRFFYNYYIWHHYFQDLVQIIWIRIVWGKAAWLVSLFVHEIYSIESICILWAYYFELLGTTWLLCTISPYRLI